MKELNLDTMQAVRFHILDLLIRDNNFPNATREELFEWVDDLTDFVFFGRQYKFAAPDVELPLV